MNGRIQSSTLNSPVHEQRLTATEALADYWLTYVERDVLRIAAIRSRSRRHPGTAAPPRARRCALLGCRALVVVVVTT